MGRAAAVFAVAVTCSSAQGGSARPPLVDSDNEAMIHRGLRHLVRTQNADGSWRSAGRIGSYPTAMTALAGLALLASGSTPTRGIHWSAVRRCTDYLLRAAQPDGLITAPGENEEGKSMYGHGFATLFLAEAYGMEEDHTRQEQIHGVLTRAVRLIARAQSRAGGWLYTPSSDGDEGSVTIAQIQALRACRNAGITVPGSTIERAVRYLVDCANPDGGIRYSATSGGPGRPPITAAAVAVLYNAGRYDDPLAERSLVYARRTLPINGSGNPYHFYSQLYLAQALYQRGGDDWDRYYRAISDWLAGDQRPDGSWLGDSVGTAYGTAIALIVLQLPFALVPILQR